MGARRTTRVLGDGEGWGVFGVEISFHLPLAERALLRPLLILDLQVAFGADALGAAGGDIVYGVVLKADGALLQLCMYVCMCVCVCRISVGGLKCLGCLSVSLCSSHLALSANEHGVGCRSAAGGEHAGADCASELLGRPQGSGGIHSCGFAKGVELGRVVVFWCFWCFSVVVSSVCLVCVLVVCVVCV